jgi:uncharacterized protein YecE (DUF72 family)
LRGEIATYARRFDLLELRAEPGRMPRASRLRSMAAQVPDDFVFSVRVPREVAELAADEPPDDALEQARAAAAALGARWFVVQTPSTATPSSRTRERLERLVERLGHELRIAWEPRGAWEDAQAEALARAVGVDLVRDLTRAPAPAARTLYTRLGAFERLGAGALERAAEALVRADEAYVVIAGRGAERSAKLLRELIA